MYDNYVIVICSLCVWTTMIWVVNGHTVRTAYVHPTIPLKDEQATPIPYQLRMPDAKPNKNDHYMCTAVKVPKGDSYIYKYEALSDATIAHHILLYACGSPATQDATWECFQPCQSRSSSRIIWAWAKNAPPLDLPEGVAFHLNSREDKYLVMQVHYIHALQAGQTSDASGVQLDISRTSAEFAAGIYLLMTIRTVIPPETKTVHADASCRYTEDEPIYPFAFRTHAHDLGKVITGYIYNGTWNLMARGNPQWPQAFYNMDGKFVIHKGDSIIARCTFSSIGRNRTTYIGATGNDEMCNLYVMYYTDATKGPPYGDCAYNRLGNLVDSSIPDDSDVPPPINAALEMEAHGHHHHSGPMGGDSTSGPSSHSHPHPTPTKPLILIDHGGLDGTKLNNVLQNGIGEVPHDTTKKPLVNISQWNNLIGQGLGHHDNKPQHVQVKGLQHVPTWPVFQEMSVGQVGGLANDAQGNVYIFHRAGRIWDSNSFDHLQNFKYPDEPIQDETILVLDSDGRLIDHWGSNKFYMPHGITIDTNGSLWMTDVAMHQVLRFPAKSTTPDLTLGVRFEPGSDDEHFCKPADVAVLSTGEFFVADGYCNSRIMKFAADGTFIKKWGGVSLGAPKQAYDRPPPGLFNIVHSIIVAEDKGLVCAADRENGRIQCFDLDGNFVKQISATQFGGKLFAIDYCPLHGGLIFAVNGGSASTPLKGFTIDIDTGTIKDVWTPNSGDFTAPHALTVDSVRHSVYVGELVPDSVWKFKMEVPGDVGDAVKKGNIPGMAYEPVEQEKEEEETNGRASMIIGALLIVPVILMVVIVVIVRLHSTGKLTWCGQKKKRVYNLGAFNYFNSHKGFDRLNTEDSDHEADPLNGDSDSDTEISEMSKKPTKA